MVKLIIGPSQTVAAWAEIASNRITELLIERIGCAVPFTKRIFIGAVLLRPQDVKTLRLAHGAGVGEPVKAAAQ